MRYSRGEKLFQSINYIFLFVLGACSLFPFLYIISVSMTPMSVVMKYGGFLIFPQEITFDAYVRVFTESSIPSAFLNSVFVTFAGTLLSLLLTMLMAFGLAKHGVPGRKIGMWLVVFTMLFNGGIIPTYLIIKDVGLLNSLWALFIPTLISPFNLLIFKTFLEQQPPELEEASTIDGASEIGYLVRIVIPLSLAVIATIGLFYAVFYWNIFFPGILYITNPDLYPLQVALRQLIVTPDASMVSDDSVILPPETMKMAAVVVSTLPIVLVYPFLQKYFVKGATLGAVKG